MKNELHLSTHDCALMVEAIGAGRNYFEMYLGLGAALDNSTVLAFQTVVESGHDIPAAALMIACYGLECLYWKQNRTQEGIPELLMKLEKACNYKRVGFAAGCSVAAARK